MSLNLNVSASVVDIRTDNPRKTDVFLIDTNVWYWLTYTRASMGDRPPIKYQISDYPAFLKKAIGSGSRIVQSTLNLAEISHIIERTEREIFAKTTGFDKNKTKEFRHTLPSERVKVVSEISASWAQISNLGIPIEVRIDEQIAKGMCVRMSSQALDGYDILILETLSRASVTQILTDDVDFATVTGLTVFTSNNLLLRLARDQGKLIVR